MLSQPKILVCTDFSHHSDKALKMADQYAQKTRGEVIVLHVDEISYYIAGKEGDKFRELMHSDLRNRMKEQLSRCNLKAHSKIIEDSNANQAILNFVNDLKIDVILIADKGTGAGSFFSLGGLSRKLINTSQVPVFLVKNESPINKVAALVSSVEEMAAVIDGAEKLAVLNSVPFSVICLWQKFPGIYENQSLEYTITFMNYMNESVEQFLTNMRTKISNYLLGKDAKMIVKSSNERNIGEHLVEILHDEGINFAVLKKRHKTWIEKRVFGSVGNTVVEHFKGNILVL